MHKLVILLLLLPTLIKIKDCIAGLGISFLSLEAAVEAGQLSQVLRLQFFGLCGGFAKECQSPGVRKVGCL